MEEFSKNIEDDSWFCFDLLNLTVIDLYLTPFDLKRFKTYAIKWVKNHEFSLLISFILDDGK